jgi:hypothetical protein
MDWIPALLKHLAISRSVIGATFVTSCALYFGPRFAPEYVDAVPKEWGFVVISILIFSGLLLVTWALSGIWDWAREKLAIASEKISSLKLCQDEINLLYFLGENPSEPLNLDRVNYEAISLSRLEVLNLVHNLESKGLVSLNPYSSSELVFLTSSGRQRSLEIQRASKAKAAEK